MPVNTAAFLGFLEDDAVVYGSATGVAVTTRGDWVGASAWWVGGTNTGWIATPAYKTSGMGIALSNNPVYDSQGVARSQSALPIATRGIFRVPAMSGASGEFPVWSPVVPRTSASGIVGQTGATGIAGIWGTAPMQGISANPTGAIASGVGRLVKVISDGSTGQWDIMILPARPDYF